MSKKQMSNLLMITMVLLLLSGCATTNGKAKDSEGSKYTGFLSDYSQLKPESEGSKALKWVNPRLT